MNAIKISDGMERKLIRTCGAAWLGLLIAPLLGAARLPFRFYRNPDGLPQSQVMAVLQDRRGEIWVGTWCGAGRFDGARFRNLSQGSAGLPSNYVYSIAQDGAGDLWLATGYGVVRLAASHPDAVAESFYPISPAKRNNSVRQIYIDARGTIWAATTTTGVARRTAAGFQMIATPEIDIDGLQVLAGEPDGALLAATRDGLFSVTGSSSRRWRDEKGPWNEPLRMVYRQPGGALWFATAGALYHFENGRAEEMKDDTGHAIPLARSALSDRLGRLWIATEAGLYRRDAAGAVVHYGLGEGLLNERVYAITEDREGNLWFGTDDGLAKYAGDLMEIYLGKDELPDDSAWSLGLDPQGRLLAGFRHGVARFDGRRFSPWPLPNPLSDKVVRAIAADDAGGLWFGTRNDGLFHWDGRGWRQFKPPEYPELRTYAAFKDKRGVLWFGTREGVARWNGDGFTVWRQEQGLPDNTVWMIREDPAGRIVVCTDRGMARLEGERFTVPDAFKPFADVEVRSFLYAGPDELWVGTNGRGLFRITPAGHENLRAGSGPTDDFVWGMARDTAGRLWVGTNHGFDVYDGNSWSSYTGRDGLVSEEIAVNAALATADGAVWFAFGGDAGVVRFNPRPFAAAPLAPLVRVTQVATPHITHAEPARLAVAWDERDLTFHYIGVSFRDERRVLYQTRLEGYDKEFSPPRPERSVRYTNLAPGHYRFLVKAAGAGGLWSEPAAFELEILAPFWRRPWFFALAALALLLAVVLYVRRRLRGVIREKQLLEEKVGERTRDLEEKMAQLTELKEKYVQLSITDPLTGLYNRRHIREQIEREIARARRHGESIGVALIDLDHFKTVNDRFGHPAGDTVLVHYARMLSDWFRKSDLVARYGGEEFIIAFLNADEKGPLDRTDRLREKMATQKIEIAGQSLVITLSAGVVVHAFTDPKDPTTVDDLLRMADERLYRAKAAGRNKVITQ
jgi:diguanylate cyclase (GGDEF)-like protein